MKTVIMAVAMFGCVAHADLATDDVGSIQTGRYSYIKNIPPNDQLNPLKVVIKTKIPQSANTVQDAVEFLLARSGYSLADERVMSAETKSLLLLPLPHIHRKLGPMTLDKALSTLSGESFELVIDPVHRKVSYELSSKLAVRAQ